MPAKSKTKGKNAKRNKGGAQVKKELIIKEEGQEYAQVQKNMGNGRMEVYCFDGQKRLGIIRGNMRKKQWIKMQDIVLVGVREYQDEKCDIIGKYTPDEARQLIKMKEIPDTCKLGQDEDDAADNAGIVFDNGDSDDNESDDDGEVKQQPAYWVPGESDESDSEDVDGSPGDGADEDPGNYEYRHDEYKKHKVGGINIDDI